MKELAQKVFKFYASYGVAVVMLLLLFTLTLLGTLEQVNQSLFDVQKKYFTSIALVHHLALPGLAFKLPLPLPGGYLVMSLLFGNLICGGLIRSRKSKYTVGILIAHAGMIILFLGALVTFKWADHGNMLLCEGESADEFVSYNKWNIEIVKAGAGRETLAITQESYIGLGGDRSRTFYSKALPFDLEVRGYARNSRPVETATTAGDRVVDGYRLEARPLEDKEPQNQPGAYVVITNKETGEETGGIIWAGYIEHTSGGWVKSDPLTVRSGDDAYTIGLTKKRWPVPFEIRLDDFIKDMHPGTGMAANYESEITKFEDGQEERSRIYMNHPLRHKGYTLFQESFQEYPDGTQYSQLAVWRNPADQWPLYSCIVMSVGLLFHMVQKLLKYMKVESERRAA
ncbi:MAG: cytochrome c biogenesis protein ResB [Candidatus Hydrogenedentes bacterium]|jgi:hypothetical protein|nr:cytochrome c biogenesis protein ResB [Candidatus Hydrogenedentota bacterium]